MTKKFALPHPKLLSIKRIWDHALHNGMTGLIEYQGAYFCCFREGIDHQGHHGSIRILKSHDLKNWTPVAYLTKSRLDALRQLLFLA